MVKLRYLLTGLAGVAILSTAGLGVASAAANSNVGSSGIPKSVFREERQEAIAQVLNTSVANVQAAIKNKTLNQLITVAGLNKTSFKEKLKNQLTTDLEAKGYSQDQITIALQHRAIVRLHHKLEK